MRRAFSKENWLALLLSAVGIAFISFLFVREYSPPLGILWNIMNAEITLVRGDGEFSECFSKSTISACGYDLPYRWVFAGCFALAGYAIYLRLANK